MFKALFQTSTFILLVMSLSGCITGALIDLQSGNKQAHHKYLSQSNKVSLPFYWLDGHIVIELAVNNKSKLKFALDSGAAVTVVFETERTKGLELDISQSIDLNGAEVNIVEQAQITLTEIAIEELVVVHVPISQSPLFANLDEAYFDGAIGYDLLNQYVTEIDFEHQQVHFYKPNSQVSKESWWAQPIELYGNVPHIKAALNNDNGQLQSFNWVVDTGAPDYLYFNSKQAKKFSGPNRYFTSEFANFEGKQLKHTGRINKLELFGQTFVQVSSHDLTEFKDPHAFGLIGAGLLRNFNLRFDYGKGLLWTSKNKLFSSHTLIDRSGLELEPHKNGAVVQSVSSKVTLPIREKDVVTKINGASLSEQNFDEMRNKLSGEQERLAICWLNKGKETCAQLALADR